ncbi:DUF2982 domain-containing protein [Pseudoalteromonas sp. T1lg65]|uniref:DUF2982 domain-containing protein n=1 Tax=Pseudoalteromonas sp. T1lg65 TaxID=2077101 RepID=UPI003F7A4730
MDEVKLRALTRKHGLEFMLIGGIVLIVLMVFVKLRPTPISILEIIIASAMLVLLLVGFLKSQQPYFSLTLSPRNFSYIHKYGSWSVTHHNFHSSGIPKVQQGIETLELNAVGIKLNDIDDFLSGLTPRLAGKLLIEQRHIFLQAVKMNCKTGNCPTEWLVEDTQFKSPSGIKYTGLLAMFANRMNNFKTLTGYHLIVPSSELDRDIWQFSTMLNRWKLDPSKVVRDMLEK